MILDEYLEFIDAGAVNTGGAANYLLGDVIDLSTQQIRDIGNGQALYWVTSVDTALLSGTGTFNLSLVSDAQAAIATDGSATVHSTIGGPYLQAALAIGTQWVRVVPLELPKYERYLGILQTTATAAFTAGKINSFLTLDPNGWKAYPDGVN